MPARTDDIQQNDTDPRPVQLNGLAADPELLGEFIVESREHLASVEVQTLALEQDPGNMEAIHAIFRGYHTIKGLAGFLELPAMQSLAHEVETVLDLARNAQIAITATVIDHILEAKDFLNVWLGALQSLLDTGAAPSCPDPSELIARIRCLGTPSGEAGDGLASLSRAVGSDPVTPAESQAPTGAEAPLPAAVSPTAAAAEKTPAERPKRDVAVVKVNTAKLDYLVDMVGEMVIAQSLVRHDPELDLQGKPRMARNLTQLARITDEVQRTAMSMRMVPIGHLFQKMSRLARDLSKKTGKAAELIIEGEGTELDRNIVEQLADPLMHMLRNALDHGIESPEERLKTGKPAVGRVRLSAGHQCGHIVIEVSDDGRGLRREKILAKAAQNGIIAPGAQPTDSEVFNLIFQPGFSTADRITDVSGRGVGMDVVRKHIQKLRGRIDIESTPGKGTTFYLKVPLTLAIIDALVAGVGSERYIMPIYAVREMLRPTAGMISTVQGRAEMALVRGALLPIVRLHERFNVTPRSTDPCEALLIVSENAGKRYCLMVDELIGKQEVVIKSLGEKFQHVQGVAGGAILGDGRVGLILDLELLFGVAHE